MASQGLPHLLAIAITPFWTIQDECGSPRPDPVDELCQPSLWGAPRIHGELLKLGVDVSQATVGRYLPRRPKTASRTWRSFLHNHLTDTVAIDMFIVATATFRILYTLIVLDHVRRKIIHFGVTKNPTQVWLSHQIAEAFPWDTAPRYLLRNRDASYGPVLRSRVKGMGVEEVVIAPRSPWQNPFVEHVVGSIRRECLDHVIVFNERHLRHVLSSYFQYYREARTHLSLNKDCPQSRPVQPPSAGKVVAFTKSAGCTTATNVRPLDRLARQVRYSVFRIVLFFQLSCLSFSKFLLIRIAIIVRDAKPTLTSTTICVRANRLLSMHSAYQQTWSNWLNVKRRKARSALGAP
jgi:Integrase core domain